MNIAEKKLKLDEGETVLTTGPDVNSGDVVRDTALGDLHIVEVLGQPCDECGGISSDGRDCDRCGSTMLRNTFLQRVERVES